MPTPLVSVVIGLYNPGSSLAPTVEALLAQSLRELEIIVVDDGSTDDSPEILAGYAARDSRIRIIRQQNQGLTSALIAGCNVARGRFIARQDCGDISHPLRLATQLDRLSRPDAPGFVSCRTRFEGPAGEFLFDSDGGCEDESSFSLPERNLVRHGQHGPSHHGSVTMHRDLYLRAGGYRPFFKLSQDWDLWYRLGELAPFALVPNVLYHARHAVGGLSLSRMNEQREYGQIAHACLLARRNSGTDAPLVIQRPVQTKASGPLARNLQRARANYFIGECLRRNGNPACITYFTAALKNYPLDIKSAFRLIQAIVINKLS